MNRSLSFIMFVLLVSLFLPDLTAQDQPQQDAPDNQTRIRNWLQTMDKNDDGKISREEATGLMKNNFARVDTNKDGFLDRKELIALAGRLRRNQRNNNNRNQQSVSDQQLKRMTPEGVTVEPNIAYRPGDSEAWRLDLARPTEKGTKPRPAIVFIHGGGWRSGDKRRGTFLQGALDYAAKGYVCVTVNYRLIAEAPFPACIEDCKCAVRWLRANAEKYNIDPNRIGGFGNSAGAHLVAMLGLAGKDAGLEGDGPYQDQSSLLQAVCCSATPTYFPENWNRALVKAKEEERVELAKRIAPLTYVRKDAPPFLMFHGTADKTVNVEHSDRFSKALKEAGATDVTYMKFEDAGHGVFGQHSKETAPAMEKFFARTLKLNSEAP